MIKVAPDLISTLDLKETKVVCADKGYDSEPLREQIRKTGLKRIYQRKTIANLTMTIWTGIYIKSGI
jgi:IS5 family transposase